MGGVSSEVRIQAIRRAWSADRASIWRVRVRFGTYIHICMCMCMSESRVRLLTATGVGEHPAAIGAVEDATIPLPYCQVPVLVAVVDDGELVRLFVGSDRG
jgi:hypothetical protein